MNIGDSIKWLNSIRTFVLPERSKDSSIPHNKVDTSNGTINMWEHTSWGDAIYFLDYKKGVVTGHMTPKPIVGNTIISKMKSGRIAKFEVIEGNSIKQWSCGAKDQFIIKVKPIGYVEEGK